MRRIYSRYRPSTNGGFAYLALLILIATIGLTAASVLQAGVTLERRGAEEELLAIGTEFHNALVSYRKATPAGQNPYPLSMNDLLKDSRFPVARRHLRKLNVDPLTGLKRWGFVEASTGGGIIGIYSLSEARPIKRADFGQEYAGFDDAKSYRQWIFAAAPPGPASNHVDATRAVLK